MHLVALGQTSPVCGWIDRLGEQAAVQAAGHRLAGHIIRPADTNAVGGAAVFFVDDDILGDVDQAAGQVAGVCRAQRGIGQAFARAVRGDEVFQRGQALRGSSSGWAAG